MLSLLIGDGKGKTTSALGTALRSAGWEKKVLIIQFIKSNSFQTGERKAIERSLTKNIDLKVLGLGFVGIREDKKSLKEHKLRARKALKETEKAFIIDNYDLVILDEILGAITGKLLTTKEVLALINKLEKQADIILTGRKAPKSLREKADLISEIKKIKHPFDKGILAKQGLDF